MGKLAPDLFPHQIFGSDFNQLFDEAQRQEAVNAENRGELEIAQRIHDFIVTDVGPLIEGNQWVYEGAWRFAEELVPQYFTRLRLTGEQTLRYQTQLHTTKAEVIELLTELANAGKVPDAGNITLAKASDFPKLIEYRSLTEQEKARAAHLQKSVRDHEVLQLNLTLGAISYLYELGLPRVMFVFRRALKEKLRKSPTASDHDLGPPSDYLDWIRGNLSPAHILCSHFASDQPRTFYRTARNVANHHLGLDFDTNNNLVRLVDRTTTLEVPLYEFQQRYRYLVYLVDYGVRGVLFHFARKERGNVSSRVCHDYEATFPGDIPGIASRGIKDY